MNRRFAPAVVRWQRHHGRHDLPWQGTRDPYAIWISEAMLQQTRVETVIPRYLAFLARLPDVAALASAAEDGVVHVKNDRSDFVIDAEETLFLPSGPVDAERICAACCGADACARAPSRFSAVVTTSAVSSSLVTSSWASICGSSSGGESSAMSSGTGAGAPPMRR